MERTAGEVQVGPSEWLSVLIQRILHIDPIPGGRRPLRKTATLLVLVLLAASVEGAFGQAVTIVVETNVDQAEVLVDGSLRGRTGSDGKMVLDGITPGEYRVSVRRDGYRDQATTIAIDNSGLDRFVTLALEEVPTPTTSSIFVVSNLPQARVFLGNRRVGQTDASGHALIEGLPAGRYTVSLRREGYRDASRTVELDGVLDGSLQFALQELPAVMEPAVEEEQLAPADDEVIEEKIVPAEVIVVLESGLAGAEVWLDGVFRGRTGEDGRVSFNHFPGEYLLRVSHPERKDFTDRIRLASSIPNLTLPVTLSPIMDPPRPWGQVDSTLLLAILLVLAILVFGVVSVLLIRQQNVLRGTTASSQFDRYVILRVIGVGGMATVYLARDRHSKTEVALKVLNPEHYQDKDIVSKFLQEGQALDRIASTHPEAPVVRVLRFGREQELSFGRPFITLELLEGENLLALLRRRGRLDVGEAVSLAAQISEALKAAHAGRILHRDVTPDNVIVVRSKPRIQVKLIDFGVARHEYTSARTMDGSILGKPAYMSPEQCGGREVTEKSDIYSLGILCYTMLTGNPPFLDDNPLRIMHMHEHDDPPPLAETVPSELKELITSMLDKRPEKRPSAKEVAVALARIEYSHGAARNGTGSHEPKPQSHER